MDAMILFDDLRPYIRYVQRFRVTEELPFHNVAAYDNRLFYCTEGEGHIRVGDTVYLLRRGVLLFWRAGIPYDLQCGSENYTMFGCNFDFTRTSSYKTAPVPPTRVDSFRQNEILDSCRIQDMEIFDHTIYLENMQRIEHILREMYQEYVQQRLYTPTRLSALMLMLLTDISRAVTLNRSNTHRLETRIEEIMQYVRDHYADDLGNKELGRLFNYHPNHINRLFVTHTGMSLHKYLLRYRIHIAIDLLQTTDTPATLIAERVGFRDYNHFLKYFKKVTGNTTKAFRP